MNPSQKNELPLLVATVALPRPLYQLYSYVVPNHLIDIQAGQDLIPGSIVRVPFGRGESHGFVISTTKKPEDTKELDLKKLKSITCILRSNSVFEPELWKLCLWAQNYYFAPPGDVLNAAVSAAALGLRSTKSEPRSIESKQVERKLIDLNEEQEIAFNRLNQLLKSNKAEVALLKGITGSGKTEVYIRLALEARAQNKGVIFLVPEIALTPQLQARIELGMGETVVPWHSALSDGQRRDYWHALRSKKFNVVVGARSAVFAPVCNLGLIIIDEEHDQSYKQEDRFRYHARDLALVRANFNQALAVLGSATPSFESLEKVKETRYHLVELRQRFAASQLPEIHLIDLKTEAREQNARSVLTEIFVEELRKTLLAGDQAMVFLNRRGFAAFLLCSACGESVQCPNCSVTLTYYQKRNQLECHYCAHKQFSKVTCKKCGGFDLQPVGFGTEGLEDDLEKLIPEAKILRLDRDQVTSSKRLGEVLAKFERKEANLLLGTQMLVKGHDYPGVTFVGVILADALFRWPDFRAHERAYQILTQVSGRAGRGKKVGQVFIQCFDTEHISLKLIDGRSDIDEWINSERESRMLLSYPPFGRLARVRFQSTDKLKTKQFAEQFAKLLHVESKDSEGLFEILGPSEAMIERAHGQYRYEILVKCQKLNELQKNLKNTYFKIQQKIGRLPVDTLIDIDPQSA